MSAQAPLALGDILVRGAVVDAQTRCAHYASALDVVALRLHCCGEWYPCVHCHDEAATHSRTVWPRGSDDVEAAVCGVCARIMRIAEYRAADACPSCAAPFNPGCALHHPLYFG